MKNWIPFQSSGIAIFPYESMIDNHLKLVCGDSLEITHKNGDWVRAKCLTTSCIGICPINHIQISGSAKQPFDLLEYEARVVVNHIFTRILGNSCYYDEKDCKYIDLVQRILENLPIKASNRLQIAKYLDEFRDLASLPSVARTNEGCIMRAHDLTISNFSETVLKTSEFPKTVSISVTTKSNFSFDVKVSPMLYDTSKQEIITVPCDRVLFTGTTESTFTFVNVDASLMNNIAFVLQVYKMETCNDSYVFELIGMSAEQLNTPNREFKTGHPLEINLELFTAQNSSDLTKTNILQKSEKIHSSGFSLDILVNATDTPGAAVYKPETINTLKPPINIDYTFNRNSIIISPISLTLPKRMNKIRMSLRILNFSEHFWVSSFAQAVVSNTYYLETIQYSSSSTEFSFRQNIEASLGTENIQINNLMIVFLVDVPSDETAPRYIAVMNVSDQDEVLNVGNFEIPLNVISPEDLNSGNNLISIAEQNKFKKTDTTLKLEIKCLSTLHTSYPIVKKILNTKTEDDLQVISENLTKFDSIPSPTFELFLHRFFSVISMIIAKGDDEKKSVTVKALISLFMKIDTSRNEKIKRFFEDYLNQKFDENNSYLAEIHGPLLSYVAESFPDEYDNIEDGQTVKVVSRCLSYILSFVNKSLELSKQLDNKVDESQFSKSLHSIFSKLTKMMVCTNPIALINKSFVIRIFPVLCNVIHSALPPKVASDLAISFIKSIADDKSQAVIKLRYKMYREICQTTFFQSEKVRQTFLPFLVDCLSEEIKKDKNCFQTEIYPTIVILFFVLMRTSSNFSSSFACLTPFVPEILEEPTNFTFLVTMIYFADFNFVQRIIKESVDPTEMFSKLLEIVRKVLVSSPPPYIFFISALVFVEVVKITKVSTITLNVELARMVEMVSSFCTDFLSELGHINPFDQALYTRLYAVDLSPVAAQLPVLLKRAPPESRFNTDVLLPLFHLYLIQSDEATREQVTDGFFLVVQTDWRLKKDFNRSEPAILRALEALSVVSEIKDLRLLFENTKPRFEANQSNKIVSQFFERIDKMVLCASDLALYPNERQYEDERSTAIKVLMELSENMKDFRLYLHFTNMLYDLNMTIKNKVETAELMMLVASKLSFTDTSIYPAHFGIEQMSGRHQKKNLYRNAADLFIEAQFYERAMDALTELHTFHSEDDEDYESLSDVAKKMAQCVHNTVQERTQMNRFYGVYFHGNDFSEYFKDKTFIYRRDGFFMNDAMLTELSQKFPQANVTPKLPENDDKGPFIYVFNVKPWTKPVTNFDPLVHPSESLKTQLSCTKFYSEQPVRIRLKESVGEFAEWHMKIIEYTIADPLQGIIRRSQVINESPPKMLSPIENAISSLNQKSFELLQIAASFWRQRRLGMKNNLNTSLFLMNLNGIVNAAVNGGTKVYTDIFLDKLKNDPINIKFSKQFIRAVTDQMRVVKFAIAVHESVMHESMEQLQQLIKVNFDTMEEQLKEGPIGEVDYSIPTVFGPMPTTDIL